MLISKISLILSLVLSIIILMYIDTYFSKKTVIQVDDWKRKIIIPLSFLSIIAILIKIFTKDHDVFLDYQGPKPDFIKVLQKIMKVIIIICPLSICIFSLLYIMPNKINVDDWKRKFLIYLCIFNIGMICQFLFNFSVDGFFYNSY